MNYSTLRNKGLPVRVEVFFAVLSCFAGSTCFAQSNTATVFGTVTDITGAVVAGAAIQLQSVGTNDIRSTNSASDGGYKVTLLPIGTYDVTVRVQGFQTVRQSQVKLDVGQVARFDFQLHPGAVESEVTVTGESPLVNAANAELGTVVDNKRVQELPLNGRSITNLITLQSGTAPASRPSFQFNGVHSQGTNFMVDGTDATNLEGQWLNSTTLSLEMVAEFKVSTGILSAASPRAAGGIINIVTKSGTNRLHGSVYEYYRGNSLNAGDWFANAAGRRAGRFVSNQWAATVGGPIVKDKVFFVASYEGLRIRRNSVVRGLLPTRNFVNSVADPTLRGVLALLPTPDAPDPVEPRIGFRTNVASSTSSLDFSAGRLDWQVSNEDRIFASATVNLDRRRNPGLGPTLSSGNQNAVKRGTVGWTRLISPTMTNELRFGVNHSINTSDGTRLTPFGIINIGAVFQGGGASLSFGGATNKFCCKTLTWADNFNYQRGRHGISAGFEIRRINSDIPFLFPPIYTFSSLDDLRANRPSLVNFIFGANPAPGIPGSVGFIEFGPDDLMQYGSYVQDDWKASPRLTLNLGLRYEYFPPIKAIERKPCCSNTNVISDPFGAYRSFGEHIANPVRTDFSPRFGFAYDLSKNGRTVLRGGYGIMRAPMGISLMTANSYLNPGVSETGTLLRSSFPDLKFPYPTKPPLSASNRNLMDPNFHVLYVQTWTLAIERALPSEMVFRAIYVGNHGLRNQWDNRLNVPISPSGQPEFPRAGFGLIRYVEGSKQSKYNGLQLHLQRRFRGAHGFDVFYTWSHGFDNVGDLDSYSYTTVGGYQDPSDHKPEKASNPTDVRHQLVFDYVFEPRLASRVGLTDSWARHVLDGWALNGLTVMRTGLPVSIRTGGDIGSTLFTQRPNLVPNIPLRISGRRWNEGMYNPAAYAVPTVREPVTGYRKGNLGRLTERGPRFVNFDVAVVRNFKIRENQRLQLRFEFFNLLNQVNFDRPGNALSLPTFGRSLAAFPARQIQLGGRYTF